MTIEKLFGLRATNITLNDRFTMLASVAPDRPRRQQQPQQRRRPVGYLYQNLNTRNRYLIQEIARRLERQSKINALRQRIGNNRQGGLRRFGSETNLSGLRRSNSFGNLSQNTGFRHFNWRGYNRNKGNTNNLSRSASYGNLSQAGNRQFRRGFYRRGGGGGGNRRGGFRHQGQSGVLQGRVNRMAMQRHNRGRARGRGGVFRNQTPKPVPTKEELDNQIDEYMASSKSALDRELETYMKNAEAEEMQ